MRSNFISRSLLLISLFALTISVAAQTDQGRVAGRVLDLNGAVVPGATVTVTNTGTNESRTITSDSEGVYIVPALRAAVYTIKAAAPTFAEKTVTGVELSVGQQMNLDLSLSAEAQSVTVDVVGGSESAINTSSAAMGANVNQREVEGLPINGRQLSQLYLQAPGAVNSGTGTFGDIRFSGRAVAAKRHPLRRRRGHGDHRRVARQSERRGSVAVPPAVEPRKRAGISTSIRATFPAEFGTGTGGQIIGRDQIGREPISRLGSSNTSQRRVRRPQLFRQHIAGHSKKHVCGSTSSAAPSAARSSRTSFSSLASYEGYRGRSGLNFVEAAPSLSLAPPGAFDSAEPGHAVNPAIQPFIAAFRSPNAVIDPRSADRRFRYRAAAGTAKDERRAYSARFDYQLNGKNNLYFRFFRDNGTDLARGRFGPRRDDRGRAAERRFRLADRSSAKGSSSTNFQLGYNGARTRINGSAPTVNGLDFSAITLNISGSVANHRHRRPGHVVRHLDSRRPCPCQQCDQRPRPAYTPYSLGFIDSLSWTRGNHNIKFGGEFRLIRLYTDRLGGTTYTFSNLAAFLATRRNRVQYLGDLSAPSPFNNGLTGQRLRSRNTTSATRRTNGRSGPA